MYQDSERHIWCCNVAFEYQNISLIFFLRYYKTRELQKKNENFIFNRNISEKNYFWFFLFFGKL